MIKINKQSFLEKYFSSKVYLWQWILSSLVLLYILICYNYTDTNSLTVWSVNFWDVLYEGKFTEYFSYTALNKHFLEHECIGGDILSILPLSIWNFPIWIAYKFFGKNILKNCILMAWSKLCFVVFAYATAFWAGILTRKFTDDKSAPQWTAILTLTFTGTMTGIGYSGQSDIFFLFFAVLAIYFLISEKEKLFLLFSAISIAFKPFFLFVYVPLLLYLNKNLFKVAGKLLCGFSIIILNKIIFASFPLYFESMKSAPYGMVLDNLFAVKQLVSQSKTSVFVLIWFAFCLFAYLKLPEKEYKNKYILYFTTSVMVYINCFTHIEHYRYIMTAPFLMALIMINKKYLRLNLALTFIFQFCYAAVLACQNVNFFSNAYRKNTIITKLTGINYSKVGYINFREYLLNTDWEPFLKTITVTLAGAYVVAAIALLIFNSPKFNRKIDLVETGVFEKYDQGLLLLNCFAIVPIVFITQLVTFL